MKKIEIKANDLEIKSFKADTGVVDFYFAAWTVDKKREQILPYALNKTLAEKKSVYHNVDHSMAMIVGDPIEFGVDQYGAWASSKLRLDTVEGRTILEEYKSGRIKGHSLEFKTIQEETKNGVRMLKEIQLVGITTAHKQTPVNDDALTIEVKTFAEAAEGLRRINKLLTAEKITVEAKAELLVEYKALSEIMARLDAEEAEKKAEAGINYSHLVNNFDAIVLGK